MIALGIAGLYFGGQTIASTGGYIPNTTNGTIIAGVSVPVGSYLIDTGNAWVTTAKTAIGFIVVVLCVIGIILYYTSKH